MNTITTASGHLAEIAVLFAFLIALGIPTLFEVRKRKRVAANTPRPTGATKI